MNYNILKTPQNISESQVDFVFKNIKEQINTQEKLKNFETTHHKENDLDLEYKSKYESIISDFRIKEISKEVQNEFNKINDLINHPTALQPVDDPFGIKRGICKICLDDCKGYSPSFIHAESYNYNLPSVCSSCHCGASAHESLELDSFNLNCFITSVQNEILPCLHSSLNNEDLNFTSFLVLLNLETIQNTNEYHKIDILNFLQILREGGFNVIQSEVRKISNTLEKADKDKEFLNNKENANISNYFSQIKDTDILKSNMNKFEMSNNLFLKENKEMKSLFEFQRNTTFEKINKFSKANKNLVKNAKYFVTDNINKSRTGARNSYFKSRDASKSNSPKPISRVPEQEDKEKDNNFSKSFYSLKSSNVFNKTNFFKGLKNNLNNIHSNVEISNKYLEVFKKPVLILCLSHEYSHNGIEYFEKFYNSIKSNKNLDEITRSISLVYYSKDRVKALWDLQATFPNLFQIHKTISFVIEKPDLFCELDDEDEIGLEVSRNFNSDEDIANRSFNSFLFNSNLNYLMSQSKKENSGQNRKSYDSMLKNMKESKLLSSSIDKSTLSNNIKYKFRQNQNDANYSNKFIKSFSQFKDYLNFSSIYLSSSANFENISSLLDTLKNLSKNSSEKSNFINNLISYLSRGNNFANSNSNNLNNLNHKIKCAVTYLNKIGDAKFSSSLHLSKLDILNFKSSTEKDILSNIFFPKETSYGRVLLVLRPILVRSGLSDAILNILKLNNFSILKRKSLVLNKFQLQFLYQMEFGSGVEAEDENNFLDFEKYVKIMTDFNVEICVLSKFCALEDLKLICGVEARSEDKAQVQASMNMMNSLDNVLKHLDLKVDYEIENDLIHHDEKIKKTKYQEKLNMEMNFSSKYGHGPSQIKRHSAFTDVSSLINVNKIFLEILHEKKKNYITQDYKNLLEIKKNIIKFCSQFNIFLYNTYNEETVDQEIGFFFPEFGSIQEIFIILKPYDENDFTSNLINQNVKQILEKMHYEIVDSNYYKMSEDEFCNLFDKYFSSGLISPYEYSNIKDKFVNFNCEILRLVKPGGMIDASRIIGKENYRFLKSQTIMDENKFNNIDLLRENCYLLNLSSEIEFYYPLVNPNISIVEGGYLLKHSNAKDINSNLLLEILSSCIKSTIGEHARYDPDKTVKDKLIKRYLKFFFYNDENKIKENFINILDNYMFSKWHVNNIEENFNERFFEFLYFNKDSVNTQISFLIESNTLGFYEVRIPILDNLIDMIDINIARTYLYSDKHFFRELSSKYRNNNGLKNLLVESLPFTLSDEKNENTGIWLENNLELDTSSIRDKEMEGVEGLEGLGLNLNLEKIIDNLPIIKKRLFYKTKYESTKLFYMMCSTLCDDKIKIAPRNYHYRIKPDDITMDIRRIYETEELGGLFFIEVVSQDFLKYRSQEWEKRTKTGNSYNTYNQTNINSSSEYRYSLPSYLWGRKLAKICHKLISQNPISQSVENCGPLIYSTKEEKLKGIINSKNLVEYEQYLYINILYDLKISQDSKLEIEYDIFTETQYKIVEDKLMEVLNSEIFTKSRSQENIMLTLSRLNEMNLRISRSLNQTQSHTIEKKSPEKDENNQKTEEDRKLSNNNYNYSATKKNVSQSNYDHELNFHQFFKQNEDENISSEIANKNIFLTDIFCYKGSKYRSYAAIQYLFNIVYKKLSRKSFLLNNNEEEYDKMLEAILLGFNNNIQFESPEVNDSNKFNAFKVDYFLYVLSEMKFVLNDLHICKKKLKKIEEKYKILSKNNYERQSLYDRNHYSNHNHTTSEFDNSYLLMHQRILTALKNNINEANINLEILFFELMNYDCKHVVHLKDNKDYIVLPKERYHIPMYFEEKWERDLNSNKYIFQKKLDKSYLMDIEIVKHLSKTILYQNTLISESLRVRE